MVFFVHIIIFDSDAGLAMSLGQTVQVTVGGAAPLSKAPLEFVVR
jgi:Xaa-Pro dipeptidase